MKAKILEITETELKFQLLNEDGSAYTNASASPVEVTVTSWINNVPEGFTKDDVVTLVRDKMKKVYADHEQDKAIKEARIRKRARVASVIATLPEEIDMAAVAKGASKGASKKK